MDWNKSVTALHAALLGYGYASWIHHIEEPSLFGDWPGYEYWIALRTKFYSSPAEFEQNPYPGWKNMLLELYVAEDVAFDEFFRFLDEYRARSPRVVARATLDRTDLSRFDHLSSFAATNMIELVKYTQDPGVFVRCMDESGERITDFRSFFVSTDFAVKRVDELFSVRKEEWVQIET